MMHWSAAYVGVPYVEHGRTIDSCDCWGLLTLVFGREKGIALPSYSEVSPKEMAEIERLARGEIDDGTWVEVERGRAFDAALFRQGRFDSHIGIMIDGRQMLHSDRRSGTARIDRIDAGHWRDQFAGFYRHKDLT